MKIEGGHGIVAFHQERFNKPTTQICTAEKSSVGFGWIDMRYVNNFCISCIRSPEKDLVMRNKNLMEGKTLHSLSCPHPHKPILIDASRNDSCTLQGF